MNQKGWCAAARTAGVTGAPPAAGGNGANTGAASLLAAKVSGAAGASSGSSNKAGGTSSLGCIGETLTRLPQRARTVLPQKVITYSPFLTTTGRAAHLISLPLRKVENVTMSSGSACIDALRSAQSP